MKIYILQEQQQQQESFHHGISGRTASHTPV